QLRSENSSIFYDPALYNTVADCIVTSSSVASRYRQNRTLYAAQNAFYDTLAAKWKRLREFGPQDGSGPRITIWGNPHGMKPFANRDSLTMPPLPQVTEDRLPGSFSAYFERYGYVLEAYGFCDAAVQMYLAGLRYKEEPEESLRPLVTGAIRSSMAA